MVQGDQARLLFVGAMVAGHPGRVTTQEWTLSHLFEAAGYAVTRCSSSNNRWVRLYDTARTVRRVGGSCPIQVLSIYGGRSFVVEDVASRLGRRAGQRLVMVLHGGALPDFARRFPRWFRRVLGRADAIVAPTPYLARAVLAYGFTAQVLPNVIDLQRYPFRARASLAPRLFWMRTFHPFWNPEMALRVLSRLRARWPGASLVMAGEDRGTKAAVEAEAARLGLRDAVRFPGFLDMKGKAREGSTADVFINTNRIDNMPVAAIEAGAMGLPIVSTVVGGIGDFLRDGENALLVPDDDDAAMADAVGRLLSGPPLAARLSLAGRALAETCAWTAVRPQWEALFASVLEGRAPAGAPALPEARGATG